jgi:spectrin beta
LLQKFLTDLSASSKRIEALDASVEEFIKQGHSKLDKVQARQKHIHQLWDHLNWLKGQKERSLEGASRYLSHSVVDSDMKVLHT